MLRLYGVFAVTAAAVTFAADWLLGALVPFVAKLFSDEADEADEADDDEDEDDEDDDDEDEPPFVEPDDIMCVCCWV